MYNYFPRDAVQKSVDPFQGGPALETTYQSEAQGLREPL